MAFTLAFTLPHVALLHSVTLQYIRAWLGGEVFSILSSVSLPYLYSTNLSALIGLRILTHYAYFRPYSPLQPYPLTLPLVNAIPCAPLSVTHDGSSCITLAISLLIVIWGWRTWLSIYVNQDHVITKEQDHMTTKVEYYRYCITKSHVITKEEYHSVEIPLYLSRWVIKQTSLWSSYDPCSNIIIDNTLLLNRA